ncbi:MAG TPA: hypothetical protein VLN90_05160, partial [Thioalkalivibrio sp.]|nr:hypothetical protein [Thioalkalivibrio sp.]
AVVPSAVVPAAAVPADVAAESAVVVADPAAGWLDAAGCEQAVRVPAASMMIRIALSFID